MDTFKRLPRAATEPLPALADFLQPFHMQFGRRESQAALERYLTGLLTDHPRKNCDTLPTIVPGTGEMAYYWSNFPSTTPLEVLVEYAHRRHHIERFHQDAKDELG